MLSVVRRSVSGRLPADVPMHPVLRQVYDARGLRRSEELSLTLDGLLPVSSLEGVHDAAELLRQHRDHAITVVGDFDADGATSTALVLRALHSFGFGRADFLVPNRFEYGYGLTPGVVALVAARGSRLIVTVDNGVSSIAGVAAARAAGLDVLVTDHHLAGAALPDANIIVNPNLVGSQFGSRALAGVGVAFYVCAALRRLLESRGELAAGALSVAALLDLVALGTVADVVPLDRNNRVLVSQGLARIRAGRCAPGITALLELAKRTPDQVAAADMGYAVAPRLNAAGRLADMSLGIRCLLTDDPAEARQLAEELDALNVERRRIESQMQAEAIAATRVLRQPGGAQRSGVVLFDASWHQGVVGLVAGRIKEQLRRPVIAFALADAETLRGSARSVAGVHIRDVLDAIAAREPDLIQKFGGHAMAAGLSLARGHLDRFARAFDAEVTRCLQGCASPDVIETDGELATQHIAIDTARALREGGPWGAGFPEPLFDGVFDVQNARVVGDRHLKLQVAAPERRGCFDAIAFNQVDPLAPGALPAGPRRLVYRLDANEYRGEQRLQLVVEHVLPVG
jgi:single-stranded-DNA-specific exonuclease